jgi:putative transcriptional regulator
MEENQSKITNRIRVLRAEKNISQQELADAVDVSRQAINAVENDKYVPSTYLALKIAKYFKVTVEDVFQILEK